MNQCQSLKQHILQAKIINHFICSVKPVSHRAYGLWPGPYGQYVQSPQTFDPLSFLCRRRWSFECWRWYEASMVKPGFYKP